MSVCILELIFLSTLSPLSLRVRLQAYNVFLMQGESAAIVLDSDNTADSFVLPAQTQTALTICFGALIMHVTVPRGRKKKGKPGKY